MAGAAAQAAYGYLTRPQVNYYQQPYVQQPPPQIVVPRRRTRRRRQGNSQPQPGPSQAPVPARRRRGRTPGLSQGLSQGITTLRLRDAECIAAKSTILTLVFSPGKTSLPRLDAMGVLYRRYRIHSVNIQFRSEAATTETTAITWGVEAGPKLTAITTKDHILKLRPVQSHSAWKTTSITLGPDINPQRLLLCNGTDEDSVAFTLYAIGSDKGTFVLRYDVELSYPVPN